MYTNTLGTYKYTKDDIPCFSKKVLKKIDYFITIAMQCTYKHDIVFILCIDWYTSI